MIKKFIFIVIILIGLFGNSSGREFSPKCHPTFAYWYNQFYDYDKSKPGINERKLTDSPVLRPGDFPVFYSGDEPYLFAVLDYNGDISDLSPLGIEVYDTVSFGFSVKFPLSILPQVDSMPAVKKIYCRTGINTPPIDTIKQNQLNRWMAKDSVDVNGFIEMNMHQYSIDTTGVVPMVDAMIFTNGNYSQLDSLGINTGSKLGTTVVAWIPIALISVISSLESVEKIILPSRVRPNN